MENKFWITSEGLKDGGIKVRVRGEHEPLEEAEVKAKLITSPLSQAEVFEEVSRKVDEFLNGFLEQVK